MAYKTNLTALNALCVDAGGTGSHDTTLDALNELCDLQNTTHAHTTNRQALHALYVALGGSSTYYPLS